MVLGGVQNTSERERDHMKWYGLEVGTRLKSTVQLHVSLMMRSFSDNVYMNRQVP